MKGARLKGALEVASLSSRVLPLLGLKETGNKGARVRRKSWALAWPVSKDKLEAPENKPDGCYSNLKNWAGAGTGALS